MSTDSARQSEGEEDEDGDLVIGGEDAYSDGDDEENQDSDGSAASKASRTSGGSSKRKLLRRKRFVVDDDDDDEEDDKREPEAKTVQPSAQAKSSATAVPAGKAKAPESPQVRKKNRANWSLNLEEDDEDQAPPKPAARSRASGAATPLRTVSDGSDDDGVFLIQDRSRKTPKKGSDSLQPDAAVGSR